MTISASRDQDVQQSVPAWAVASMVVAGLVAIAGAVYQVATDGPPEFRLETAGDWFRELGFLCYLAATSAAVASLRPTGVIGRAPATLIQFGYGLLALGVAAGLVMGEDPEWFAVLGAPGNLLAGIGFVWWAVKAWRSEALPGWACALAGVGGFVAILGSEFGTGVLIGSFWLWLAAQRGVPHPSGG